MFSCCPSVRSSSTWVCTCAFIIAEVTLFDRELADRVVAGLQAAAAGGELLRAPPAAGLVAVRPRPGPGRRHRHVPVPVRAALCLNAQACQFFCLDEKKPSFACHCPQHIILSRSTERCSQLTSDSISIRP